MRQAEKFFHAMTVGDVMSPAVLVLPLEMSLVAAARLLLEQQLRVALVIDSVGRCAGALSASDVLRWAADGGRADKESDGLTECVWSDWQLVDVLATRRDEVRRHMMRDPLLVTPDTCLEEIVEVLLAPHHRPVIVVDDQRRPLGVVSSKDVLAALASVERWSDERLPAAGPARRRFAIRRSVQLSGKA